MLYTLFLTFMSGLGFFKSLIPKVHVWEISLENKLNFAEVT